MHQLLALGSECDRTMPSNQQSRAEILVQILDLAADRPGLSPLA